jgi:metal-responsive CopG/Arc/MetJ family transcriptional regulator
MKTIQMTIDEPLLTEVDRVSQALKTNRSEFIREALKLELRHQKIIELERSHAEGYARHPAQSQEFAIAESDLVWGAS